MSVPAQQLLNTGTQAQHPWWQYPRQEQVMQLSLGGLDADAMAREDILLGPLSATLSAEKQV